MQNLSNVLQPKSNVEFFLTSGKRRFNAPGRGKGKKGKDGKGKDAGAGKGGGKYGTQYPQAPKGGKGYSPQIAGSEGAAQQLAKFAKISNLVCQFLKNFGGLVLVCTEADLCK